uniref:Uncharacterized protein n=1 Tax=Timema cristinae TaxID=61476 RepID=A0A7R9HAY7_TIMCR|nr:unnamed protein product [Timema cristinae]
MLRDISNPFEIPERAFQSLFRISRVMAQDLCGILRGRLQKTRTTGIPVHIQVLAAIRFFAEGGYQRGVGQDAFISLSQTSTGLCIHAVCNAVVTLLAARWIVFPTTVAERERVQQGVPFDEHEAVAEQNIALANENVGGIVANDGRRVRAAIVEQYFNH